MAAIAAYHVPLGGQSLGVLPFGTSFFRCTCGQEKYGSRLSGASVASCASRDFTLDRRRSQSVIDAARVPKGNVPGYVCNHGSLRNETLNCMPYFLHPCERLASTFEKLTLLVPDALLSSLVSTSLCP